MTVTITGEQLARILPRIPRARFSAALAGINATLADTGITTAGAAAAFIAQLAHESGSFRYFEELADGSAYEGRRDLGNTELGDGRRYKGRGPIQVTGRSNYRTAGEALGLPLETQPELAADPVVGFRIAGWYWTSRKLTPIAESGDFTALTRRINGGVNGLADRLRHYHRACKVLGVDP